MFIHIQKMFYICFSIQYMALIKLISEIVDCSTISCRYKKAIEKAIFEKTTSIQRVVPAKEKKKYSISRNSINPIKTPVYLFPFTDYLERLKKEIPTKIFIETLHTGISIKMLTGKKKRNLFSLRHPRLNSDNNIYAVLILNSITDISDLNEFKKVSTNENYEIVEHENYYKILNLTLTEINTIINYEVIQLMIKVCNRYQKKFKIRKNVS